jgi:Secretion system C-terminal sorting domain
MKPALSLHPISVSISFFLFFLLLCFEQLPAQPQLQWYNYPGGVSLALDDLEHVYTANWDYNPGGDITLTKRDSSGTIIWESPYNNTDDTRHEVASWVETDSDNNVLISGTIRSGYSNPVNVNGILMKYGGDGTLLWRVNTGADFDGSYTIKCLVDESNNIYVLSLGNTELGMRTQVKKFNSDGVLVWTYFDADGIGAPLNFKFTSDNAILLVCRNVSGNFNGVAKVDQNGNLLWIQTGIPSATVGDAIGDIEGNTYIVHGTNLVGQNSTILEKRSSTGQLIWESSHTMVAFRVEIGPDQMPVISGFPSANQVGVAFAKFNETGGLVWENNDADGPLYGLLAHGMMKIDEQGSAYVIGSTMSQMALCKVYSDGSSAFTIESPSGYPVDFDLGNSDAIYLVGGTTSKFNSNDIPNAIAANSEIQEDILLYPNPSNKEFNVINTSQRQVAFYITDLSGNVIFPLTNLNINAGHLITNDFSAGIYLFHYTTNDNSIKKVKRVMVN